MEAVFTHAIVTIQCKCCVKDVGIDKKPTKTSQGLPGIRQMDRKRKGGRREEGKKGKGRRGRRTETKKTKKAEVAARERG
ncbi:MAG: hypothetical protein GY847_02970 [Proteobacteria bacterium]|nr:hypothetical protein [Pseudomonadota bacterium]